MPNLQVRVAYNAKLVSDDVERGVAHAVGQTLLKAKRVMRARLPTRRKKTRKYLRTKHQGKSGRVGVKFPSNSRYPKRGTKTETLMQQAWDHAEPITRDYLNDVLTDLFEELK